MEFLTYFHYRQDCVTLNKVHLKYTLIATQLERYCNTAIAMQFLRLFNVNDSCYRYSSFA